MKQKIQLKTPITYWGGKQKMLDYILPLIPKHRIYTEAFSAVVLYFWQKSLQRWNLLMTKTLRLLTFIVY
jgi:DNA adenine methylase